MNRKDYDSKDGFEYITGQQKEVGKCCGTTYNQKSGKEKCKNRENCNFFKNYEKTEKQYDIPDFIFCLPIKWFRRCNLYKIKKGGKQ